jgi:predicted ATPase
VLEEKMQAMERWCEESSERGQFLRLHGIEILPDQSVTARYRFIHALYQQVLYEHIAEVRRVGLRQLAATVFLRLARASVHKGELHS